MIISYHASNADAGFINYEIFGIIDKEEDEKLTVFNKNTNDTCDDTNSVVV